MLRTRKLNKVLSTALIMGMVLGTTSMTALAAQEVDMSTGVGAGDVPTSFEVTADMLDGGDLLVTIPEELILEFDYDNEVFTNSDVVNVAGNILPTKEVNIETSTSASYVHADTDLVTAPAVIDFGEEGESSVTAQELRAANVIDAETGVDIEITSTVEKDGVAYIGEYATSLTFNISVDDQV